MYACLFFFSLDFKWYQSTTWLLIETLSVMSEMLWSMIFKIKSSSSSRSWCDLNNEKKEERQSIDEDPTREEIGENPFGRKSLMGGSSRHTPHKKRPRDENFQWNVNPHYWPEHNNQWETRIKVDTPEFDGRLDPNKLYDWLLAIERALDYKEVPPDRIIKLVTIKLTKNASLWWDNMKIMWTREGREKIVSWLKMRKALQRKYISDHYNQYLFLELHWLKQD